MTTEELIKNSIHHRNLTLWDSLNKIFNIKVEQSNEPNYLTNFKENQITIFIDQYNLSPASMTHELLHIELKRRKILISSELTEQIAKSSVLNYIFSKNLEDHIGNCLEHNKMIGIFNNLGFKTYQFISDYDERKMTDSEMLSLNSAYKENGIFNKDAVDFFIGKFFAMKACLNPKFNYKKNYLFLNKLDSELYNLLNEFWDDWLTFDISDPNDTYDDILDYFIQDLLTWSENKTII